MAQDVELGRIVEEVGVTHLKTEEYDKGEGLEGGNMPAGTRVHRCVQKVMKTGKSKPSAIRICQTSTNQSYKTGRKPKKK